MKKIIIIGLMTAAFISCSENMDKGLVVEMKMPYQKDIQLIVILEK